MSPSIIPLEEIMEHSVLRKKLHESLAILAKYIQNQMLLRPGSFPIHSRTGPYFSLS
jgi:hypothetical protein